MVSVLQAVQERGNTVEVIASLLEPRPEAEKRHIFLASFCDITRERAHHPQAEKHKLQQGQRQINKSADKHRKEPHNERGEHYCHIQLVVTVTTVHKITKHFYTS
jgi:hypothetical protein